MKKLLLSAILCCTVSLVKGQSNSDTWDLSLSGGYRITDFRWSIAGNTSGKSPNVLSEVKWQGISGPSVDGKFQLKLTNRLFLGGAYSRAIIRSGYANDTDYGNDNRQNPVYQANLDGDEGHFTGFQLYGGFKVLALSKIKLAIIIGYSADADYLLLLNHKEDVPGEKNLRTTYQAKWKGVRSGFSGDYRLTSALTISAAVYYTQMSYNAVADWNLIDAFQHPVSFRQKAEGYQGEAAAGATFNITSHLSAFITGEFGHAETGTGADNLFLDSGKTQYTQFNGAVKNSTKISCGLIFYL